MKTINIKMEDELHKKFKEYCNYEGYQITGFIRKLIREELKGGKIEDQN